MPRHVVPIYTPTTGSISYTAADATNPKAPVLVTAGDTIAALEVCKMEVPITSPATGSCRFFFIPGQIVNEGVRLAEIVVDDES